MRTSRVESHVADLGPDNAEALLSSADLILDGTDNFETRYLVNDFAVKNSVPWIYAAAVGSYAVTMNVLPGEGACLACIFPDQPRGTVETCDTAGILNSAANWVASVQATEAIKCSWERVQPCGGPCFPLTCGAMILPKSPLTLPDPECRACAQRDFPHLAGEGRPHITLCGRNSVQIHERRRPVDFAEMNQRLGSHGQVRYNDFVLKFWREPYEMTLFPDGRAIIKGTTDTAVARSLYARFVGS